MRDERLPVLLKRELSQRFHRLDLPQKTNRPAATTFYTSERGRSERRVGDLFAVARQSDRDAGRSIGVTTGEEPLCILPIILKPWRS